MTEKAGRFAAKLVPTSPAISQGVVSRRLVEQTCLSELFGRIQKKRLESSVL